jgi:hypothetical protein
MPAALTKLSPLPFNVPIVYPDTGFPTSYFQQMLQRWLTEKKVTDDLAADAVPGGRQVIAGAGLTGGGALTADITLDVGAGTGITVGASDVAIDITAEAERIRDVIGTALVAGSNITITVNDPGDTITIASAAGYTDEQARDAIGTALVAGSNISITVNDPSDTITIAATGIPSAYTDEQAQDAVGNILTDSTTIDFTYNDGANTITADVLPSPIRKLSVSSSSGTTYTLSSTDVWKHVRFTNAGSITLTVNTSHGFAIGERVRFTQAGAGQVTLSASGTTLNSRSTALKSAGQYAVFELECVNTNEFDVLGDMTV